jgi:hypothetical protein
MWLLNTESLQLKEFYDSQVPPYAILSHRWGDNEVSFQEFQAGSKKNSEGHEKIANCSSLAGKRRLDWAWIDTCCLHIRSNVQNVGASAAENSGHISLALKRNSPQGTLSLGYGCAILRSA